MHNKSSKNGSERFWPTPRNCSAMAANITPEAIAKSADRFPNLETVVARDFMPTSSPLTEPTTPGLICSQGDFLANLSVSPGSEEARQMSVRSGRKCCELLTGQSPLGSLVRMLLESSRWNSTISYLTWKPSATPRGRLLFRLVPSMPDTEGTEFGLWPTPRTVTGGAESAQRKQELGRTNSGGGDLQAAVKMWPTPTSRDHKDGTAQSCANVEENGMLGRVIHDKANPAPGSLNPNWVEWLMGYPIGHTACEGWVTRLSHK